MEMTGLEIRRAVESEIPEIWQLTHDQYAARGYIPWQKSRLWSHYEHLEWIPETTQLVAIVDGDLVGTVTYTLDGPHKLHTDVDYPYETEIIRQTGLPLAASWRIVTDSSCRQSHCIAMEMMRVLGVEALEHGSPLVLCTFNPRHEKYYSQRLDFRTIATKPETHGLSAAPSILMVSGPRTIELLVKG
jgi:hypothetical protein